MKIIVTRPLKDALPLIEKLQERGHEARATPLLDIVARSGVTAPATPFQLICLTSANGLVPTLDVSHLLEIPLIAVGPQSAAAARRRGFQSIIMAGGDVQAVVETVTRQFDAASSRVLYLSGQETSGDLEGQLCARGFSVTRLVTYDAVARVPATLIEDVAWAEAVMLYSPRSAKLWEAALASMHHDARHLLHVCLSENVSKALRSAEKTIVSARPEEAAMLSALDRASEHE